MNKVELALCVSYLLMTCYFFINWLRFSLRHPTSSPEDNFLSFIIFVISTILWPLLIPMSFVRVIKTRKLEFSTIVPAIIAISAFSFVLYMV